ncbi:hypothetical protein QJS10_CPA10g01740 [Acorus calamus]|uniref:tRNA/rRNA methyltransferase SpoU type domain-containing protein n=1 Tax=Acorus calamus TaxID=4465 RepID=A0AAV9E2Q2_ACOCL|nr:hypothetical protein QJS10_CPA10g01740 [Acorus calamus]
MDQTGLRILNRTASINLHVRAFSFHGGASSTDSKRDRPSLIHNPRFAPRFPRISTSVKTRSNGVAEAANNGACQKHLQVVLVSPQIPGNTGTIARTCAASAVGLHLIEPLGFQVDDAKLKRAGLDYWPYVVVKIHSSWMDFREYFMQQEGDKRLLAFTKRGRTIHSVSPVFPPLRDTHHVMFTCILTSTLVLWQNRVVSLIGTNFTFQ